jgi:hypothetical protein
LTAEARNHFQRLIGDRTTPPGISERARIMLAVIAESEQANAPAATEKPDPSAKPDETKGEKTPAKGPGGKTK